MTAGLVRNGPLTVNVTRGELIESTHAVDVAVVDQHGTRQMQCGEIDAPMLPRSCAKPLQVIGMLHCGLQLGPRLLAVAGASHAGEPFHLAAIAEILVAAGCASEDLLNQPDLPTDAACRAEWLRSGRDPDRLAHNCSGKHAAMLATCRVNGWSTADYCDAHHPLQVSLARHVGELTGTPLGPTVIDGCGTPIFATPLHGLARAFARLASAESGPPATVAAAFRAHPEYASGTHRDELALHRAVPGLVTKAGAEGTYAIGLAAGIGIAFKVRDGGARARPAVVTAILAALDINVDLRVHTTAIIGGGEVVGAIDCEPLARGEEPAAAPNPTRRIGP